MRLSLEAHANHKFLMPQCRRHHKVTTNLMIPVYAMTDLHAPLYTCPSCPPLGEGQDLASTVAANCKYTWYGHEGPVEGDIYRMIQSVRTPMDYLLTGGRVPGRGTTTTLASSPVGRTASSSSHRNVATPISASTTGVIKYRPCVIVSLEAEQEDERDEGRVLIYVMATYESTKFQDLPLVYRHFSVAVYPNIAHPTGHVHFRPEWQSRGGKPQWIIAYPIPILREELNTAPRWYTKKAVEDSIHQSHHRLDPHMYARLRGLARRRLKTWGNMCTKDKEVVKQSRIACGIPSWVSPFSHLLSLHESPWGYVCSQALTRSRPQSTAIAVCWSIQSVRPHRLGLL